MAINGNIRTECFEIENPPFLWRTSLTYVQEEILELETPYFDEESA